MHRSLHAFAVSLPLLCLAGSPLALSTSYKVECVEPVSVLVLGTFHMGASGDPMNPNVDDLFEQNRQTEIRDLVNELARFRPTAIALEALPTGSMQEQYERFMAGDLDLGADERHQIGFRLAHKLGHSNVHSIDHDATIEVMELLTWAHSNGQGDIAAKIMSEYGELTASWSAVMKNSMKEIYRTLNSNEIDEATHKVFMSFIRVGTAEQPVGVETLALWHERNLYIAANIVRLAKPGDRVVVLIGANHRKLLIEFLGKIPGIEIVDTQSYLDGA